MFAGLSIMYRKEYAGQQDKQYNYILQNHFKGELLGVRAEFLHFYQVTHKNVPMNPMGVLPKFKMAAAQYELYFEIAYLI